ncbi:nitrogenase component 1 [uncultured Methanoregula sp.]|uniref:nitrogenase component 1 n=1 Tax=uncultured Methanoregula sp. TaxID=1005933 RepID=UPI002AAAFABC|nr:nitrogenase component 1 [uncultured Methanoregula sp.]
MPECTNPLWPCAMTGAAACLAGFEGISVVIHGSSGCYYYPATLLHAPLHGTFILEHEIIFGSEERLLEVVGGLSGERKKIAVITTCVPAVLGEDIRSMLEKYDVIFVDSPGFSGDVEIGYRKAVAALPCRVDPDIPGVNLDGVCLFDPYASGNVQELHRLLRQSSIPVATVFCQDRFDRIAASAGYTVGTNDDFASGIGKYCGGTLGLEAIRATFGRLADLFSDADISPVLTETDVQEERIIRVCDKYLQRYDPPSVVIAAGYSYGLFAARVLRQYLDADIRCICSRNPPQESRFVSEHVTDMGRVNELIRSHDPDLVIGSSFERSLCPGRAFAMVTPPMRGEIRLSPRPLAGINGTLSFVDQVLNAVLDTRPD